MRPSGSEQDRLEALASYNILDTPPEEPFDRLAHLAAWAFDVKTAIIAFVDAERRWVKATTGHADVIPREQSFCMHVVMNDEVVVVQDARRDPRFSKSPLVTGAPEVQFYAGAPIRTPNGLPIGAVGLYGSSPQSFSESSTERLEDIAALTTEQLELRRTTHPGTASSPDVDEVDRSEPVEEWRSRGPLSNPGLTARLVSDGVIRLDPEGRIVWTNDHFVEMSGYSREELHGRRPSRLLLGPATSDEALDRLRHQVAQREPFSEELLHYRKSGVQYWVQIRGEPLFEEDGRYSGYLVAQTDVTEGRHQGDALSALTSFYERALTELPIEAVVMDREGRYLFINPAAVSDDEMRKWLIGKTAVDYARRRGLDPAPFEERLEWIQRVVEEREPDSFDDRVTTDDGETRHIMRVAHPVVDDSAEVTRVFAYGVDVTERKERERKLREAKERAEEMSRLKTAFLANMSHEIRTPLTSIIGFAEVLADEVTGKKEEMADLIQRSGMRLKQTLTSVLDLARLEGDAIELSPRSHNLVSRIRETVELLRPQVQTNDLSLSLQLPDSPVRAQVDGAAFDRVLTNLLTNAIKFTSEGGITVTLRKEPETAEMKVADTGVGISESFRKKIFDAFRQESGGTTRDYGGIGLGLTITKRLVTLMDGDIDIESTKGEGTTVSVVIPREGARSPDEGDA